MLKYIIVAVLASTAAYAAPPASKKEIQEAVQREQLIKDLAAPPKSVFNICRGC